MDLSQTLTIYGRKPVLEALSDASLTPRKLHLAHSNKPVEIVRQIQSAAKIRGVDIQTHDRGSLSRISRNGKQDQGVALDLFCPQFSSLASFLSTLETRNTADFRGVLLDGVTNPQNVGMTIRSCCAAGVDAIFYPKKSVAALGPLVIKASAGTVFSAPIIQCDDALSCVTNLQGRGFQIAVMDGHAKTSLFDYHPDSATVYVLGGETDGASTQTKRAANLSLHVPMKNGVESLNVAVTAALVAFYRH
jgi:23S rRNA (guanosine2251-2'-O)-methyltransferase